MLVDVGIICHSLIPSQGQRNKGGNENVKGKIKKKMKTGDRVRARWVREA